MKITSVKVIVTCPGRNFVTLKVDTDAVVAHAYQFDDGSFTPAESSGHGVDIDEKLAAEYPCQRAVLPVRRLQDGTLWNL